MKLNNSYEIVLNITSSKDWIPYNSIIISTWISEDEKTKITCKKIYNINKTLISRERDIISILQIIKVKYQKLNIIEEA